MAVQTTWFQKFLLFGFGLFFSILLLEASLHFLPVYDSLNAQAVNSAQPVARYATNRSFTYSVGWNLAVPNRGKTNNDGFVSDQIYLENDPRPLLAVVGDSFVEALVVPYRQTVTARLAEQLGTNGRAYSFAMSRSAFPQYLAYAKYAREKYRAAAATFIIVGNDFDESHMEFRSDPWAGRLHYFQDGANGKLEVVRKDYQPTLSRQLLSKSALLRYLYFNLHADATVKNLWKGGFGSKKDTAQQTFVGNTSTEQSPRRMQVSYQSVDTFLDLLPSYTGFPKDRILFVLDGLRPQVYTAGGVESVKTTYLAILQTYFLEQARKRGYEVIDLNPIMQADFKKNGKRFEQPEDFHWSGEGHRLAAETIAKSKVFRETFKTELQNGESAPDRK